MKEVVSLGVGTKKKKVEARGIRSLHTIISIYSDSIVMQTKDLQNGGQYSQVLVFVSSRVQLRVFRI